MVRLFKTFRAYLTDNSGVMTPEWMGVMATAFVLTTISVYAIFGGEQQSALGKILFPGENPGLIELVDSQAERVAAPSEDIKALLVDVEGWTPGGS